MNVRFWTFRNRAMDIRLAVTAAFLAALLVIPPRNCRAEDPPIFNLLPPPTVNSKAPQEAIPAVAEDQHSTSDMPPAFVPTKRAPLLPPPFVPEEAVSPAVPQLANLPDAEQVLTSSTASSPFDAPTLAIDESTVIIGPDKLPPLDDTNYSGFPTNHQGWDPGAPPITSMDHDSGFHIGWSLRCTRRRRSRVLPITPAAPTDGRCRHADDRCHSGRA
jgi:hypothetical protein